MSRVPALTPRARPVRESMVATPVLSVDQMKVVGVACPNASRPTARKVRVSPTVRVAESGVIVTLTTGPGMAV